MTTDVRFPDLGTEGKNARRMSGSVVGPMSSRESDESNDIPQILVERVGVGLRRLRQIPAWDAYSAPLISLFDSSHIISPNPVVTDQILSNALQLGKKNGSFAEFRP